MLKQLALFVLAGLFCPVFALAQSADSVDLSTWRAEGGGSNWQVLSGNDAVFQTVNGAPTIFFDPNVTTSQGDALNGKIRVATTNDNDFIGFVLGYKTGDISAGSSNFFLVDWKQGDQAGTDDTMGYAGIAISHVTDSSYRGKDYWSHVGGVREIQRGSNLSRTGWEDNKEYSFNIVFTNSMIEVKVDGVGELSITPADVGLSAFADGSFGFYNMSQSQVLYSAVRKIDCTQNPGAPECASVKACDLVIEQLVEITPGTDGSGGGETADCGYVGAPRPDSLSFKYTGGGCELDPLSCQCRGDVEDAAEVSVSAISGKNSDSAKTVINGYIVTPNAVNRDEVFTLTVDVEAGERFDSDTIIKLTNADGATESNRIHTSCSKPFGVGDVFGSLTLVAINGLTGDSSGAGGTAPTPDVVSYQYNVTNNGDDLSNITVVDDVFGPIGDLPSLLSKQVATFYYTTDNYVETIASVTADLNGTQDCSDKTLVYDSDGDGKLDDVDNCILIVNPDQLDSDENGVGDLCERELVVFDTDGDGVSDDVDNCPFIANALQLDTDKDLIGDDCDASTPKPFGCNATNGNYDLLLMLLLICAFSYSRNICRLHAKN